jgi:hypothetical protein
MVIRPRRLTAAMFLWCVVVAASVVSTIRALSVPAGGGHQNRAAGKSRSPGFPTAVDPRDWTSISQVQLRQRRSCGPLHMDSFLSTSSSTSRSKQQKQKQRRRIDRLMEWAKSDAVGIQVHGTISLAESPYSGIGWNMAGTSAQPGSLLMTVPSTVEKRSCPCFGRGVCYCEDDDGCVVASNRFEVLRLLVTARVDPADLHHRHHHWQKPLQPHQPSRDQKRFRHGRRCRWCEPRQPTWFFV